MGALVALLICSFALTAARAESVLRRGEAGDPASFDPPKTSTVIEADVLYDLFEGLLTYDASGALVPGAAESFHVSPDGRTYVFKLRDAKWSNGDPVTAGDFVFSFRRLLDPATGAEYANLYYPIKNAENITRGEAPPEALGVRAIDDRTLEITLERPTPYFLAVVAHQTAAPVNPRNVEKFGRAFAKPGNLVSNGAFRLAAFTPNDETVLIRTLSFTPRARWRSTRKHRIDRRPRRRLPALPRRRDRQFRRRPADDLAFVRETLEDEFHVAPTLGVLYLAFNTKKPPFDDARVRNACRW